MSTISHSLKMAIEPLYRGPLCVRRVPCVPLMVSCVPPPWSQVCHIGPMCDQDPVCQQGPMCATLPLFCAFSTYAHQIWLLLHRAQKIIDGVDVPFLHNMVDPGVHNKLTSHIESQFIDWISILRQTFALSVVPPEKNLKAKLVLG